MRETVRVFISYTHDSEEHKTNVLGLADTLRSDGINVIIDQYYPNPPHGWPNWMATQIHDADFVLCICTESYYNRVTGKESDNKTGLGSKWEGSIITQALYESGGESQKFIPILLNDTPEELVPEILRKYTKYRLNSSDRYEDLYRYLTDQPAVSVPPVGDIKKLEPVGSNIGRPEIFQLSSGKKFGEVPEYGHIEFNFPEKLNLKKQKESIYRYRYNLLVNASKEKVQQISSRIYSDARIEAIRIVPLGKDEYNLYIHTNSTVDTNWFEGIAKEYKIDLNKISSYYFKVPTINQTNANNDAEMTNLVSPLYAKSRERNKKLFFMKGAPGYLDSARKRDKDYFEFWEKIETNQHLGVKYLRDALKKYFKNKNDQIGANPDSEYEIAETELIEKIEQRYNELIT